MSRVCGAPGKLANLLAGKKEGHRALGGGGGLKVILQRADHCQGRCEPCNKMRRSLDWRHRGKPRKSGTWPPSHWCLQSTPSRELDRCALTAAAAASCRATQHVARGVPTPAYDP